MSNRDSTLALIDVLARGPEEQNSQAVPTEQHETAHAGNSSKTTCSTLSTSSLSALFSIAKASSNSSQHPASNSIALVELSGDRLAAQQGVRDSGYGMPEEAWESDVGLSRAWS